MFDRKIIEELLSPHCLVNDLSFLPRGHARVGTKLLYPDGSGVDLFIENLAEEANNCATLSDFGHTFAILSDYNVRPLQARSRVQTLEEVISPLHVLIQGDKLVLKVAKHEVLPDSIIRLGQACVMASCLVLTRRLGAAVSFVSEVGQTLDSTGRPYLVDFEHEGPFGTAVKVDFRVDGGTKKSSILTMSGASRSSAHAQANEVFRKWNDLLFKGVPDQLITIYDQRTNSHKAEDLRRLERVSAVLPASDTLAITGLIAA